MLEKNLEHLGRQMNLRLARQSDVPAVRKLVNVAYDELAQMGLNYTATYQDEDITWTRLQKGRGFVLECGGAIIATIALTQDNYFTNRKTAYIEQFAVLPDWKRKGIGSLLMDHCEEIAESDNYDGIQLDTAIPATHLVNLYLKRGYKIVGEMRWDGKTYTSYIFEKSFK